MTRGKPLRAFRYFCLAKDQHALCGKAFRMLAAPCVQRLRTSVRSGSPTVRVRCLDRQPAGATRPRQQRARASRSQRRGCPGCGSQPQRRLPAFVSGIDDSPDAASSVRVAAPLTVILVGKLRVTGLFCAIFLPNSIRRPSSDTHFIHPKHRCSIKDSRDDRVMSIAADHDAPKSTAWLVCASSVQLLDDY